MTVIIKFGEEKVVYYLLMSGQWYTTSESFKLSVAYFVTADVVFDSNYKLLKYRDTPTLFRDSEDIRNILSEQELTQIMLMATPLTDDMGIRTG